MLLKRRLLLVRLNLPVLETFQYERREIMYICIKSDSKHIVTSQLISITNQLTGFYTRATMTWYELILLTHIFQISLLLISYVLLDFWRFLISLQKYKIPIVINGDSLPVPCYHPPPLPPRGMGKNQCHETG